MPLPPHMTSIERGTNRNDHGTPDWLLDVVRQIFGPITHDLASSKEHNERVGAQCFWSEEIPFRMEMFQPKKNTVVWCNPPGPSKEVKRFWKCWNEILCGIPTSTGAFLVFNIDHWRMLSRPSFPTLALVLKKRLRFVGAAGGAPMASVLVLPKTKSSDVWRHSLNGYGHVVEW